MKAFLSHSWSDAEFVRAVAEELGRQFTWLDIHAFRTGDDFIEGMEAGIRDSSIFVLFASRRALGSVNVQFEISEAKREIITKALERALVFVIEPGITHQDLPIWLQRAKISDANAPKPVARTIRRELDEAARARQRSLFIGRSRERHQIESQLFPADGTPPPRVLILTGLPGIGRRSLLERVASDHWNLVPSVQIRVESGDELVDVVVKLADRFEPYNTVGAFREIANRVQHEDEEQLHKRLAAYMALSAGNRELPVFIDDGAFLDNEGAPTAVASAILKTVSSSNNLYAAVVTRRRPDLGVAYPSVRVQSLPLPESKQLVTALAARAQLLLRPEVITEIAEAADGYPPSIYHGVELVRDYGADVALADRARLVASRMIPLIQYFRAIEIAPTERAVLRLLAAISPLPMPVLGAVLGTGPEQIAPIIGRLIDASLVTPDELGNYWLAQPMRVVVVRELKELDKNEYAQVADGLAAYLQEQGEDTVPLLDIARSLYRAHILADEDVHREAAFSLSTDLIAAAETLYHKRDYRRSIEFAREALKARPDNYDARYTLCRAFIKTGEFEAANREIDILRNRKFFREAAFLQGLLLRHRGHTKAAIREYEAALERGYKGLAIHRELAQCYLALDELREAKHHAQQAARGGADNRFLVDLEIKIALQERDERTALKKLQLLRAIDRPEFYHHRASTVYSALGRHAEALEEARHSVGLAGKPTFAMLSQLAMSEIRAGELNEAAKHIQRIDTDFPNQHHDIRIGLRCQLEIARGRYHDALLLWNQLHEKEKPVHLALRRNVISGLLTGALPDALRAEYTRELEDLAASPSDHDGFEWAILSGEI